MKAHTGTWRPLPVRTQAGYAPIRIDQLILFHMCEQVDDDDLTTVFADAHNSILQPLQKLFGEDYDDVYSSEKEERVTNQESYKILLQKYDPVNLPSNNVSGAPPVLSPVVSRLDVLVVGRVLSRQAIRTSMNKTMNRYSTSTRQLTERVIAGEDITTILEEMTELNTLLLKALGEFLSTVIIKSAASNIT